MDNNNKNNNLSENNTRENWFMNEEFNKLVDRDKNIEEQRQKEEKAEKDKANFALGMTILFFGLFLNGVIIFTCEGEYYFYSLLVLIPTLILSLWAFLRN